VVHTFARFDIRGSMQSNATIDFFGPHQGDHVHALRVGSVTAPITVSGTEASIGEVRAASGDISSDIELDGAGTIGLVQLAEGGNLRSHILAPNGRIDKIELLGGVIASSSDPTNRVQITAKNGINQIVAREIRADIVANANGGTGNIARIATTNGPLVGTVRCNGLNAVTGLLEIAEQSRGILLSSSCTTECDVAQLNADVTIENDAIYRIWAQDGMNANSTIRIGGSLATGPGYIFAFGRDPITTPRLRGQIVVNANNTTGVWGTTSPIGYAHLLALSPTYYTNLSSALGGGAVGQVPYRLHVAESDARMTTMAGACTSIQTRLWPDNVTRETIVLHHYGRVKIPSFQGASAPNANAGTTKAFDIDTAPVYFSCPAPPAPCTPAWEGDLGLPWIYRVMADRADSARREVWVSIDAAPVGGVVYLPAAKRFRVSPVNTSPILRCEDTFASPEPLLFDFTYEVSRGVCTDMNFSGAADPGDIETWFAAPADITGDGDAGVEDITLVIEAVANA
jgi:hypothetical protein